jgi:hypothetical protein
LPTLVSLVGALFTSLRLRTVPISAPPAAPRTAAPDPTTFSCGSAVIVVAAGAGVLAGSKPVSSIAHA